MADLVRVEGGPHVGLTPVQSPLQPTIALGVNESLERDDGPAPYAYAIYDLKRQGDEPVYVFRAYGRLQEHHGVIQPVSHSRSPVTANATVALHEKRIEEAIQNFYENPDYDIYTTRPTDQHEQVFVQVGHRRAHVDVAIADLIRELFRLGMDTIGSCQGRPKGQSLDEEAYIAFVRERDARRFYEILTSAGIEATGKPTRLKILTRQTADGPPADQIEVPGGNVMFPASAIDRITQRLQAEESPYDRLRFRLSKQYLATVVFHIIDLSPGFVFNRKIGSLCDASSDTDADYTNR